MFFSLLLSATLLAPGCSDGGNGFFDTTIDTMPVPAEGFSSNSYGGDVGDIDLDGLPDIWIANSDHDQLFVATGNGFADVSEGLPWMDSHDTRAVQLWDFDGDCDLDAYVTNDRDQDRIYLNTLNPPCP